MTDNIKLSINLAELRHYLDLAYERGFEDGHKNGFRNGYAEAKEYLPRLISPLPTPKSLRQPVVHDLVELLSEALQIAKDSDAK